MQNEALGIPGYGVEYIKLKPGQNIMTEFLGIRDFLYQTITTQNVPEFRKKPKNLQFINYGDTQLVYVLSAGDKKYTMLVGQPAAEQGIVEREYKNLKQFGKNHKDSVVIPFYYNRENERELYVTPYINQARCIACDDEGWGVYVPDPYYRFENFSEQERKIINTSMIAMLIRLYDAENRQGISACKIGGGDFMLEKGYENVPLSYENILKRMKLIAARDKITISLEDYIEKIKEEFSKRTYYKTEQDRDKSILINHKCRIPMSKDEIEKGIELGMQLRLKDKEELAR